jgi:hypothetical protein
MSSVESAGFWHFRAAMKLAEIRKPDFHGATCAVECLSKPRLRR